jgi:hypothetical protein
MKRLLVVLAVAGFSTMTVYTQYVFLNTTDDVTHRGFRELSLEQYHETLEGRRPFPFQWRVAGPWLVRLGERSLHVDPNAIDAVLKIAALAVSALILIDFTSRWTTPLGTMLAVALYFVVASAGYASEGYAIYYTNDFLMVAAWFAAVSLIAARRYAPAAIVVFATAWAKETIVLVPLLMALEWKDGRARFVDVVLCSAAFLVPTIFLRSHFPAPLRDWAWWGNITLNVPFVRGERSATVMALRDNVKLLLMYNVLWVLAARTLLRGRDRFLRNLGAIAVVYLCLAYVVVVLRELRHFVMLAIVIIPLATMEIERLAGIRRETA